MYGHEQGLRILWRGGRHFKSHATEKHEKTAGKANGASKEAVIISDDENEQAVDAEWLDEDAALFEENGVEYNPEAPYEPIVQVLDLALGVGVLHLAFPALSPHLHPGSHPQILQKKIVCAFACADSSIRVLSISLMPPSPQKLHNVALKQTVNNLTAGKSEFGERMIILANGTTHQSIPRGVSVTLTADSSEGETSVVPEVDSMSRGVLTQRKGSRSRSRSQPKDQNWDLLVASHSADLTGLLLVHRISLVSGVQLSSTLHVPWRVQRLAAPAVALGFSSALHPAPQHCRLLLAEERGAVRIFDCLPQSAGAQGSWLLSLYTEFDTSSSLAPQRKSVLDAHWIFGGKAILVLQQDGKWSVWDVENAGPKPRDAVKTQQHPDFSTEGWISDSLKSKPLHTSTSAKDDSRSRLAPMTPGTRKMRQNALFAPPSPQASGLSRGGISVCTNADGARPEADSVLLWHDTTLIVIRDFYQHWQSKVRGSGNLFSNGTQTGPKVFSNIQLGGEACCQVSLFPTKRDHEPEVLVTGERRLLIVTSPLETPQSPAAVPPRPLVSITDQQLLAQGDLDLHGMDRVLAHMSNSHNNPTLRSRTYSYGQAKDLMEF